MRHAFALSSFCLLMPHAAQACMPMYAPSGTVNLFTTVSWMLGLLLLGSSPVLLFRRRRLTPHTPAYLRMDRRVRLSWKLGLVFTFVPFLAFEPGLMAAVLLAFEGYITLCALYVTLKLARRGFRALWSIRINRMSPIQPEEWVTANDDYLHFSKTVGIKSFLTRRFTAAGDVQ